MKGHNLHDYDLRGSRMKIAAAIVTTAVGGVIGGLNSANGARKAADAQSAAADKAAGAIKGYSDQTQQNYQPYLDAGKYGLNQIQSDLQNGTGFAQKFDMKNFYSDPGYQFTLSQGQNAISNSAAARGGILSGGTLKSLANYTTGLANQTYGDAYSRYLATSNQQYQQLYGLGTLGLNAAQGSSAANQNFAAQTAGAYTQKGNAQASGYVGVANGYNQAIGSVANAGSQYAAYDYLQHPTSGTQTTGGIHI